jgi:hypothetical protein
MKRLITAATIGIMSLAGSAIAQDTKPSNPAAATTAPDAMGQYYTEMTAGDFQVSKIMGARVYATTKDVNSDLAMDKVSTDWDDIGEVNNIIVSKEGDVKAVILGVGGFLSIGEKNVAVKMDQLQFVKKSGDNPSDFYLVVKGDKSSLEKAPTWKMSSN